MNKIHIGASGWYYDDWNEVFYPKTLKKNERLHFYSNYFQTVEINSSFYHMPKEQVIKNWVDQVSDTFLFSVKASQYITHRKRLHEVEDSILFFFERISFFKNKIGPILFQLPPSFQINLERLDYFLDLLPSDKQCVLEFRHSSWYIEEVYEKLKRKNCALCITDLKGKLSPEILTANFTYIRLHGPKLAYAGSYGTRRLNNWKKKMEKWQETGAVFCYFDNTAKSDAIKDALWLKNKIDS